MMPAVGSATKRGEMLVVDVCVRGFDVAEDWLDAVEGAAATTGEEMPEIFPVMLDEIVTAFAPAKTSEKDFDIEPKPPLLPITIHPLPIFWQAKYSANYIKDKGFIKVYRR